MTRLFFLFALLLAACGTSAAGKNNSGNNRYADGRLDDALRDYQAAQVANPDIPEPYYNASRALSRLGDTERAIDALELALQSADDRLAAQIHYNLGNIYFEEGRCVEALEAYQQAILLQPGDEDTRHNLELATLCAQPTATPEEQQTQPEEDETNPTATPTNNPGGQAGPTPTPPPEEAESDPERLPEDGENQIGEEEIRATPIGREGGPVTIEEATRLLDAVEQDQKLFREFLDDLATPEGPPAKDW